MDLQKLITKKNIKKAAKVGISATIGVGLAYTLNEVGFTPQLSESWTDAHGWVGQWGKDFAEFMYDNGGKYLVHAGIATMGAVPTYIGLDKILQD